MADLTPLNNESLIELVSQTGLGGDLGRLPTFEEPPDVLSGAAHDDGQPLTLMDVGDGGARLLQEQCQAELFVGIHHVHEVVSYCRELVGSGLGCADVHSPVDLPAVRADDLTVHLRGQPKGQRALSGRGGAYDGQDRP